MIGHYPKIALRNLLKHKLFSLVNILGLAFGLAMCLLIVGNISYELSFEDIHENKDRIYRVETEYRDSEEYYRSGMTVAPLGKTLAAELPGIEQAAVFRVNQVNSIETESKKFKLIDEYENQAYAHHNTLIYADSSYFKIFTFPLIQGRLEAALDEPFSIMLSEKAAADYFGKQNPIGRVIKLNEKHDFTVTGIFKNIPQNTQLRTDFIASYATLNRLGIDTESWKELNTDFTYFLLDRSTEPNSIASGIAALYGSHMEPELSAKLTPRLKRLKDIFFSDLMNLRYHLYPVGEVSVIYATAMVALFILLQAIANFINLSTARSADRMKEVGMRKVFGAFRPQLMKQYLGESVIITVIASILGLIIYEVVKAIIQPILPREMFVDFFSSPLMMLITAILILAVGLAAGFYPALYLSRFKPIEILQAKFDIKSSRSFLRRALVVSQFAIAIFFIASTFIIHKQINHLMGINLGFARENILIINLDGENAAANCEKMKNQIAGSGMALSVTATDCPPGKDWYTFYGFHTSPERQDQDYILTRLFSIDYDFMRTFDLQIIEGDELSPSHPGNAIIINESAAKILGVENLLGYKLYGSNDKFYEVVGVIKDFYGTTLDWAYKDIIILSVNPDRFQSLAVRLNDNNIAASVAALKDIWSDNFPGEQFIYSFLDDDIYHAYDEYRSQRGMFMIISMVSIFIACLGIFGLVSYTTEQKTKEIGIRKVLGASVQSIIKLLSREFVLLIGIASVIAFPVAYLLLRNLLLEFAFRTSIGIDVFIVSGGIALILAMLTISYQSIKAASTNPAETLRYE